MNPRFKPFTLVYLAAVESRKAPCRSRWKKIKKEEERKAPIARLGSFRESCRYNFLSTWTVAGETFRPEASGMHPCDPCEGMWLSLLCGRVEFLTFLTKRPMSWRRRAREWWNKRPQSRMNNIFLATSIYLLSVSLHFYAFTWVRYITSCLFSLSLFLYRL